MADQVLGLVKSRLIGPDGAVIWDQTVFNPEPLIERLAMDLAIGGETYTWELTFEPPLAAGELVEAPQDG